MGMQQGELCYEKQIKENQSLNGRLLKVIWTNVSVYCRWMIKIEIAMLLFYCCSVFWRHFTSYLRSFIRRTNISPVLSSQGGLQLEWQNIHQHGDMTYRQKCRRLRKADNETHPCNDKVDQVDSSMAVGANLTLPSRLGGPLWIKLLMGAKLEGLRVSWAITCWVEVWSHSLDFVWCCCVLRFCLPVPFSLLVCKWTPSASHKS